MRYTIKGLTDRTITFNSLGITVRGNSHNIVQFPHSIARGLEIETVDQWNEVNSIIKAGFVAVEQEQEAKKVTKKTKIAAKVTKTVSKTATKTASKKSSKAKSVKRVAKASDAITDDAIIVTADGIVSRGRMTKGSDIDLQESDATKASLEAAKQIEDEEKAQKEEKPIDESKLDISERMGNDVVVSGGESKMSKTKISKSALPTVKTNWIDLENNLRDDSSSAFIDKDDQSREDDRDDRFIE